MTQTVTIVNTYSLGPTNPAGEYTQTVDDSVLATTWSTPIAVTDAAVFTSVAPSGGGTLVQFSADGVLWFYASSLPYSGTFSNGVPPNTLWIRAQGVGGTATLTVQVPSAWTPLSPSELVQLRDSGGNVTKPNFNALVEDSELVPGAVYAVGTSLRKAISTTTWSAVPVGSAPHVVAGPQITNASGGAASYIVIYPRKCIYGGFYGLSGVATCTVRHGTAVTDPVLQYVTSAAGDQRIKAVSIVNGLYLTLSANADLLFFISDNTFPDSIPIGGPVQVPMTATGRFWLGRGLLQSFILTGQAVTGVINIYDGWDNTGALLFTAATPTIGFMGGSAAFLDPIELRSGGYIELLGTTQTVMVNMGVSL
jgi:hypothetical protein